MTRLGEVLVGLGNPEHRPLLLDAAAIARSTGDAQALADVAWAMTKYPGRRSANATDPDLARITEDALRGLGRRPTTARARTLAAAAENLYFEDPDRAHDLADEAVRMARALGDHVTVGHALISYVSVGRSPWNAERRKDAEDELIAVGYRTGQPLFTILGIATRAWRSREQGDLTTWNEALNEAEEMIGDRRVPPAFSVMLTMFRSARFALAGDLASAERTADEVQALAAQGFDPTEHQGAAILLIRHAQDRLSELIPILEIATAMPGVGGAYRSALACAYAQEGRVDDARNILNGFAEEDFASVPRHGTWLAAMAALAETAEIIGDRSAAEKIGAELAPFSGWIADLLQGVIAPVDLALTQIALTVGDPDGAAKLAIQSVEIGRRHETPIFLGRELVRLAAASRQLGKPAKQVDRLVDEALAISERTGAHLIRREAERYALL
jgi:hypothetical protein